MYFFLRNLSILDMCFISITVPNAFVSSLTGNRVISVGGCATQIFLVIFCAYVEMLFLSIMAWDHYVAICLPLQYPIIMNLQFCVRMTLTALLSGLVYAGVHTGNTFWLSFCQSNVVHQFFYDVPSLLSLSFSDTSSNKVLLLVSTIIIGGGSFGIIILSYIYIFSTVLKVPNKAPGKAFSTCTPNILVVSIFLSSGTVSDVVLINKSYDRTKGQHRRNWKLKELARDREKMDTDDERQYQDFLEDLEEDEAIRKNINIYRDSTIPVESDTDDEGAPGISLAEMLEDLHISQDTTGEEGASVMT
ncbi:Olfactory receptor 14C36 [Sciurus carolinensis]|uniref:Olfactory receptor 14C36 n=1 Tax=Sciurus carolinensis TaxID=30640 RepID=A0AA41MXH5_SCICA|nr:Olfactory receptor 14C36 [Sciurus carolinensis]